MCYNFKDRHRYGCHVNGGAIVLDLKTQKYYIIQTPRCSPPDTVAWIKQYGVKIVQNDLHTENLLPLQLSRPSETVSMKNALLLLYITIVVAVSLKLFGLNYTLQNLRRRNKQKKLTPPSSSDPTVYQAVYTFRRIRPWLYTAHDYCLLDALILTSYLRSLGYSAIFVIGVRARPFQAHAWVQAGKWALDDCPETIQLFKPIFTA